MGMTIVNFGRADTPALKLLRRVLREARAVVATGKNRAPAGARRFAGWRLEFYRL